MSDPVSIDDIPATKGMRGGRRPGAGRPRKGEVRHPKQDPTRYRRLSGRERKALAIQQKVNSILTEALVQPFLGDAHALLVLAYKHPGVPTEIRLDAAKAAIGYEKPKLAPSTIPIRRPGEMTDDELAAAILAARQDAQALIPAGGSKPQGQLIDGVCEPVRGGAGAEEGKE